MQGAVVPLLVLLLVAIASAGSVPTAKTKYGVFEGFTQGDAAIWLGIPYAAPPVGQLRWKAPVPPPVSSSVHQAVQPGYCCIQSGPFAPQGLNTSEDCLYLNVYVPVSATPSSKFPVKVYIHGGGFAAGAGIQYDGSSLAPMTNTVVVTFNYRLGVYGFYALPGLLAENPTLNYGLQDQAWALTWVQQNIAAFGGDPNSVTIFGESAGGGSVHLHLWMPMSHGLFHRGIMESAGPWLFSTIPELLYVTKMSLPAPCNQSSNATTVLSCMRSLPASVVTSVTTISVPVIDNKQVLAQPLALWVQEKHPPNMVPLIVGTNAQEGNLFNLIFAGPSLNLTQAKYESLWQTLLPDFLPMNANATYIQQLYKPIADGPGGYYAALSDIFGDLFINCGSFYVADAVSALKNVPVYRTADWDFTFLNATHCAEIPYVWHIDGFAGAELSAEEFSLSNVVVDYWDGFAKTGNPGSQWPLYSKSAVSVLGIQLGDVAPVADPQFFAACAYWTTILGGQKV